MLQFIDEPSQPNPAFVIQDVEYDILHRNTLLSYLISH